MGVNGMRVNCSQRWEDMRLVAEGERFCDSCAKPVIDFTAWNDADLRAWFTEHPDSCGQFNLEQVRPDLVPMPGLPSDLLRGAFAALAALSLSGAMAQRAEPEMPATEQAPVAKSTGSAFNSTHLPEDGERCWAEKDADVVAPVKARRPRYYLSWRFPFVHKARRIRGKVRFIGCPSF